MTTPFGDLVILCIVHCRVFVEIQDNVFTFSFSFILFFSSLYSRILPFDFGCLLNNFDFSCIENLLVWYIPAVRKMS